MYIGFVEKKKRKVNLNSLTNLRDNSAPDKPGETVPITVQVTIKQKEWLDMQAESRGYHVRLALQSYIDSLDSLTPK